MSAKEQFEKQKNENIKALGENKLLKEQALNFMIDSGSNAYTYNFTWLGRPIIQYPQDMIALQEIIWELKPNLIIETGIAHGGSLILSASILELLGNDGQVLGVDIDIRDHNREQIEKHPLAKRISMIQGSSTDEATVKQVYKFAEGKEKIMLILDSNHTHDHVFKELIAYSPLVTKGSYLIVFDTAIEDLPENYNWANRPWGKGNNPKTAVWAFLEKFKNEGLKGIDGEDMNFEIDQEIHNKLLITVAPDGYLKRLK